MSSSGGFYHQTCCQYVTLSQIRSNLRPEFALGSDLRLFSDQIQHFCNCCASSAVQQGIQGSGGSERLSGAASLSIIILFHVQTGRSLPRVFLLGSCHPPHPQTFLSQLSAKCCKSRNGDPTTGQSAMLAALRYRRFPC